MLAGNRICVPSYQRAYAWETPIGQPGPKTHTDVFLSDLDEYESSSPSSSASRYYFGHFLFEEKPRDVYYVIDGQQRLTTIQIFLGTLFARLKAQRALSEEERQCFEDLLKRGSTYRFSTVHYDNQLFRDYVVDQVKNTRNGLETASARRIVEAFSFFSKQLADKDENYLSRRLATLAEATCTTHLVTDESEAIQMFIFQNNRGKKPSNLEIIKAQFMFKAHLFGGREKEDLIEEIKDRFEKIYKSISSIESWIDEDDVLIHTLRVHFNSLGESDPLSTINKNLSVSNPVDFIRGFTLSLAETFGHLTTFFGTHERESHQVHSLVTLGALSWAIPFIVKAYKFGLLIDEIGGLCAAMESLVLRHRIIGTRAELTSRLRDVYEGFTSERQAIAPIVDRITWLKSASNQDWWWAYWNTEEFRKALQGGIHSPTAKFLLWKYENYLESQGMSGYAPTRFDKIRDPELEHIAPQTEHGEEVKPGYCQYDDEFKNQYLDCLGNYLLVSKSHNCSIGNHAFHEKRRSYTYLAQQREVQDMTKENEVWDKDRIGRRKAKIVQFILDTL